jgi:hypothetical protein
MASRARTAIRCGQPAPPRDPLVARGAREPQQQIAMTAKRRAEADEIAAPQLVERTQQMMLVAQPAFMFRDDGGAVAIRTDAERISPFAAAADIDGPDGTPVLCLLRTLHIARHLLIRPSRQTGDRTLQDFVGHASPVGRWGSGLSVDPRNAAPRQVKPRSGIRLRTA